MPQPINLLPTRTEPGEFTAPQGSFRSEATTFDAWLGDLHDYLIRREQARGLVPPSAGVTKPLPAPGSFRSAADVFGAVSAWEGEQQARRGGAYRDAADDPRGTYQRRRTDFVRELVGESSVATERHGKKTIGFSYDLGTPEAPNGLVDALDLTPEQTQRIVEGRDTLSEDQSRALLNRTIEPVERIVTEAATGQSLTLPESQRIALVSLGYTDPPALRPVLDKLKDNSRESRGEAARAILYRDDKPTLPEISRRMRLTRKFLGADMGDYTDIPKVPSEYERFRVIRKEPRGIRNNNPGNIEFSEGVNWRGQTGSDGRFAQFESPALGIRALARVLKNYKRIHGITTILDVINRWAPPVENDTGAYVRSVAKASGFAPDEEIDLENPEVLFKIIPAIIRHENGKQPYEDEVIREGITLA